MEKRFVYVKDDLLIDCIVLLFLLFQLRFFASEIIRGSLFRKLGKELPYCCEVRINEFREPRPNDPKPVARIQATIFVERDTQKGIVVGKGGKMIKEVGVDAREQLEDFLQEKVRLQTRTFLKIHFDSKDLNNCLM